MKQLRAVGYIRVSTDEQVEKGTSLQAQRERCCEYADSRGFSMVKVCEDAGVSGARYHSRPGIQEAVKYIERGEAEILIVSKLDRVGRKARIVLEAAERIDQAGGRIITCDGQEYGGTAEGRLRLTMLAGFAEFERETIRERSMGGKKSRAKQGIQPQRARSPYGYRIVTFDDVIAGHYAPELIGTYQIVEEQAVWARQMFHDFDAGTSLNQIARTLDLRCVLPPSAARNESRVVKKWWPSTVRTILENSVYKGEATFGRMGTQSGENLTHKMIPDQKLKAGKRYFEQQEWQTIPAPALVDTETWNRCSRRLSSNADEKKATLGGNPERKYMLSGLTRCPTCGKPLSGQKKQCSKFTDKVPYYTCRGYLKKTCVAKRYSHPAAQLEQLTVIGLVYLAEHPESVADALRAYDDFKWTQAESGVNADEANRLRAEVEKLEAEASNLRKATLAIIRAGGSEEEFATELADTTKRRQLMEKQLQELLPQPEIIPQPQPMDTAAKLSAVAQAIVTVLTAEAEDFSPAQKQALLVQIIETVTPIEDGARVTLKCETIQCIDMHCVTRWSRLGNVWEGVSTREIIKHVQIDPKAKFVLVTAYDKGFSFSGGATNWTTNMPLEWFLGEDCLLADTHDGQPISLEHGGPLRLVIPRLYAWKSAKWVRGVEFRANDAPGFWERGGYHMLGDPWKEQRYGFAGDEDETANDI